MDEVTLLTAILEELEETNDRLEAIEAAIGTSVDSIGWGIAGNFEQFYYALFFLLVCIFFFQQMSHALRG